MQLPPETPTVNLRIARNGDWFNNDAKVAHRGIYELFCRSLRRSPDGSFYLDINGQTCPVEVEDAPFVVRGLFYENDPEGRDIFWITLNDGRTEKLDPATLRIGPDSVIRCRILDGQFDAVFSPAAMTAISPYIEHSPGGTWSIEIGGSLINIPAY